MALWGGRFEKGVDAFTQEFGASLEVDKAMAQQDIAGSRAHAKMLAEQGIISEADQQAIDAGLADISGQIANGVIGDAKLGSTVGDEAKNGLAALGVLVDEDVVFLDEIAHCGLLVCVSGRAPSAGHQHSNDIQNGGPLNQGKKHRREGRPIGRGGAAKARPHPQGASSD